MRAILIDPVIKTVTAIEIKGDLKSFYEHLQCQTVELVRLTDTLDLWIDEEGLLKDDPAPFFALRGNEYKPLCGRGLILSHDDEGNSIGTTVPLKTFEEAVLFPDLEFMGFESYEGEQEFMGKMIPVIGSRSVFKLKS